MATGMFFKTHRNEMKKKLEEYGAKAKNKIFHQLDRTDVFDDKKQKEKRN